MFPLQLLCPPLASHMSVGIPVPVIGTPAISVEATNAQRREQRFQCQYCLILSPTKDLRHHRAGLMI